MMFVVELFKPPVMSIAMCMSFCRLNEMGPDEGSGCVCSQGVLQLRAQSEDREPRTSCSAVFGETAGAMQ